MFIKKKELNKNENTSLMKEILHYIFRKRNNLSFNVTQMNISVDKALVISIFFQQDNFFCLC